MNYPEHFPSKDCLDAEPIRLSSLAGDADGIDFNAQASAELQRALADSSADVANMNMDVDVDLDLDLNLGDFFQVEPELKCAGMHFDTGTPSSVSTNVKCDGPHFDSTQVRETATGRNPSSCGVNCGSIHRDEDCIHDVHSKNGIQIPPRNLGPPDQANDVDLDPFDPLSVPINRHRPAPPLEIRHQVIAPPNSTLNLFHHQQGQPQPGRSSCGDPNQLRRRVSPSPSSPSPSSPGSQNQAAFSPGQQHGVASDSDPHRLQEVPLFGRNSKVTGNKVSRQQVDKWRYREAVQQLAQSMRRTELSRRQLAMLGVPTLQPRPQPRAAGASGTLRAVSPVPGDDRARANAADFFSGRRSTLTDGLERSRRQLRMYVHRTDSC